MKPKRIFIFLSLIGIFILLVISNFTKPTIVGEISSIKIKQNSIQIKLSNFKEDIILVNKTKIPAIQEGNKIEIFGERQISINKTTIFVNKLICTNC